MTITTTNATIAETINVYTNFARTVASELWMAEILDTERLATSVAYATIAITGCGERRTTEYGSAVYCDKGLEIIESMLRDIDNEIVF